MPQLLNFKGFIFLINEIYFNKTTSKKKKKGVIMTWSKGSKYKTQILFAKGKDLIFIK